MLIEAGQGVIRKLFDLVARPLSLVPQPTVHLKLSIQDRALSVQVAQRNDDDQADEREKEATAKPSKGIPPLGVRDQSTDAPHQAHEEKWSNTIHDGLVIKSSTARCQIIPFRHTANGV
jgi:hypothetical protein